MEGTRYYKIKKKFHTHTYMCSQKEIDKFMMELTAIFTQIKHKWSHTHCTFFESEDENNFRWNILFLMILTVSYRQHHQEIFRIKVFSHQKVYGQNAKEKIIFFFLRSKTIVCPVNKLKQRSKIQVFLFITKSSATESQINEVKKRDGTI